MPAGSTAPTLGPSRRALTADERRYYREWWIIAAVSLASIALFSALQWGQSFGFVIYDQLQRWSPAQAANDIVIIAVDDHTLQARGGWPLKRSVYTQLLQKLADSGNAPRAIGFDILFPDPMPEDAALAEQMQRHNVYLAAEQARTPLSNVLRPFNTTLAQAAKGTAHVNLSFEKDGSLRGTHLLDNGVAQLSLAMSGKNQQAYASKGSYRRIPLVDPAVGFPTASLADVLEGQVPLQLFKDKYVLIGSTAPSLGDHFPTMYSGQEGAGTPGVLLHASLLNAILRDQLIEPVPLAVQVALCWLSLAFALSALLVLSPLAELLVNGWIALSTVLVSAILLKWTGYWFDPGVCVIAIALLKPAWAWRRNEMIVNFMSERAAQLENVQRQRKKIRKGLRFRHFTSDTLLQYSRLLDNAIGMVNDRLQFLQKVVLQIPTAMLVADADGNTLLMNPRMQQDLPAHLLHQGQNLDPLLSHLGLLSRSLDMLSEKDHFVSGLDPVGALRHFIFRVAQIPQGIDKPLWVLSLSDVTEMKQFQTQRDRTLQLLSHDMRTPIASIIALSRKPQPDTQAAAVSATDVNRHARNLLSMMDDFIFSIHAQAPQYKMVEMLVDTLVDEAVFQVKDLVQAERMRLVQEFEDAPQFVMADQRLLTRVLVNLLVNAIRYGAKGGQITVRVSHDEVFHPQAYVRCTVSNTVGDFSEAGQNHNPGTGQGFGLGLDFVETVVHKHNGLLHLNLPTTPGEVATVELALPWVQ